MRKLKVLHLLSNYRLTGASEPTLTLVGSLKQQGHEVYLGCPEARGSTALIARSLGLEPQNKLCLNPKAPLAFLQDFQRLQKFIRKHKPDIIHTHLSHDHWLGAIAAATSSLPIKIVRTIHNTARQRYDPLQKNLFRKLTDFTIVLSERGRDKIAPNLGLVSEKIAAIYGAVNTGKYHPGLDGNVTRQRFGIGAEAKVIGLVSHLHPDRGHRQALAAFREIRKVIPKAKLAFLGETDSWFYKQLRQQVQELGLDREALFIVDSKYDEWPYEIAMLDVALYLAPGSEDSARAVLEVMALGKPVAAVNVGVIPEVITDRENGLIIEDIQPETIAQAVCSVLSQPGLAQNLGKSARKTVTEKFNYQQRLEKVEELYYNLL